MGSLDKIFGGAACLAAALIFVYYSIWTFYVPYLDDSSSLAQFFLPHKYAIYIPAATLVAGLTFISAFFLKASSKNKSKQKAK
ncbi:dolichol phosphate-mannose biosynthesis regulatory [Mycotypha africana]|uniref:dolichol phosphate-mannose biosynthesis regulatory n=1 Tax=Mycotypha africana TaxID=64632 RepID=UPI0022FFD946|nr:dolichol phosphate-mannose biosynthesis regulatory [Mycotypha africana]KAI8984534.1 dolichol phosphate-mannose biosynthesis regulatory [Mycotypha africana]